MRRASALLLPLFLLAAPALADDPAPEKEPSFLEKMNAAFGEVDKAFGEYFVGPFFQFLFYDVYFWDNELDGEAALGTTAGDETITGYDPEKGFAWSRRFSAHRHEVKAVVDKPGTLPVGRIEIEVGGEPGKLRAWVKAAPIDISGAPTAPFDRWAGPPFTPTPAGEGRDLRVVQEVAPFPVLVEVKDGATTTIATDVPLARLASLATPAVDGAVQVEGKLAKVLAVEGETLQLASLEPRYSEEPVANPQQRKIPFIVLWLVLGALYFTFRMGFINLRGFRHAIDVTRGVFDKPGDAGEISHFQALSSALSATVGLGNIAGVAVAVGTGGPGAVFWMVVAGFLGMSSKFVECTLGQMYRDIDDKGIVSGGPMRYLAKGLNELGLGGLGKVLAVVFAIMCIGGSFGGGNMFQANQAFAAVRGVAQDFGGVDITDYAWLFGLVLAILVGLVIIGGIKRIGAAASFIVPVMCGMYVVAGIVVLVANADKVPWAFSHIISEAFTPEAGYGGLLGVLIIGFQRAAFSNEAGVGSASIAHSAASTDEPIREGIVALLEPFIDTIIVCSMTGLVVVVTGAYKTNAGDGVLMTSAAFKSVSVMSWFPVLLSLAVLLFAFSTMISWSYYGERCFTSLFGHSKNVSLIYRLIFLVFVFFGSVFKLGNVLDFSDLMVLGMAFPNIAGLVILSGKVRERLDDYWGRYKSGAMRRER